MDRSHRAYVADRARTGERFGLGRYEWTTVDTDPGWRGCAGGMVWLGIVPLTGALLAYATAGSEGVYAPAPIALAVGGGLVALGTTLLLTVKPDWRHRFLWYSDGFLLLASDQPQPQVMRWQDVISLTVTFRSETDEGVETIGIGSCAVRDRAGNTVVAPTPPVLSSYDGAAVLAAKAEQALTARLVPELIRAFDAGEPVAFGDRARFDHEVISYTPGDPGPGKGDCAATLVAWQDIERILIWTRLRIQISTRSGQTHLVDLDGVENGFLAYHLIDRAAAAVGFELGYRDEDEIPSRAPTPI